jgi:hypothetical protein
LRVSTLVLRLVLSGLTLMPVLAPESLLPAISVALGGL